MGAAPTEVVGRDDELRVLTEVLEATKSLPVLVRVGGEAGAGKTTVWSAGLRCAVGLGFRLLVCRPAKSERGLSYAGLRDLLEDVHPVVVRCLPSPQRRALRVALLLEDAGNRPPAAGEVAAAMLGGIRRLCADGPLLVAIDDVQWLDTTSATALGYALRRLRGEPVAILLTARAGSRPTVFDQVGRELPSRRIELGPLSLGAIRAVLSGELGIVLPRPVLRQVHQTCGGNPFVALEIGRALQRTGHRPEPGEQLPVPPSVTQLVRDRLDALSVPARLLLPVVAAASNPSLSVLRLAMPMIDVDGGLSVAVAAGVLDVNDGRARFTHPLLGSVAYGSLGEGERRALHQCLANAEADTEASARHLALAAEGPALDVAAVLDDAARLAEARGAPEAAAELWEQACRLTPPDLADTAAGRRLEAGRHRFLAGDTSGADRLLTEVIQAPGPVEVQAWALHDRARIALFTDELGGARRLFEQALAEPMADLELKARAAEGMAWTLYLARADLRQAVTYARRAVELSRASGLAGLEGEALAVRGHCEAVLGDQGALSPLAAAEQVAAGAAYLRVLQRPEWAHAATLIVRDDLAAARTLLDRLLQEAASRGDESSSTRLLLASSFVELLAGDWEAAERLAKDGLEAAGLAGQQPGAGVLLYSKGLLDAHRGRLDEARCAACESLSAENAPGDSASALAARWVLGFAALSAGDAQDAHRYLAPLVDRVRRAGVVEPGAVRFVPDEIEALVMLGRLDEAEDMLAWYEKGVRKTGRVSAMAAAHRGWALVRAAGSDFDAALAAIAKALECHATVLLPFDRARTLLVAGMIERRAKQRGAARASLDEAAAVFDALGAPRWAAWARAEHARVSGRTATRGELTPTERQVATLVATGHSNKEVAAALFVTVKTVEAHLSRVYAKVGVRSRAELAHRLRPEG